MVKDGTSPILVVDDDEDMRLIMSHRLKKRGYPVTHARNGIEGLDILEKVQFSTVILDVMMPGMDGWEMLKQIRDKYGMDSPRIIITTAKTGTRDQIIGTKILKADNYLTKPIHFEQLYKILEETLNE